MSDQPFRVLGKTIVEASRPFDPDKPTGRLGYAIAGVNYIIDPKDSNRFLVRLDRAGTFVSAYHRGRVTPEWDLAVDLVKIRKGNREYYEITGTNIDEHPSQGGGYGGLLHVGPHHHLRGTDMEIALDPRQILRLKPTISTGLIIGVTAGFYWASGTLHWFPGDSLNLSDGVPETASQHRWGIIVLDLLTQTLMLLTGDSKVILQPLTSADLPDIDLMNHLPLAAVKLRYGMTSVQELDFEDLRLIFGTDGITSLVMRDAVDKTITSGAIMVGEGETILRLAPESGSADILSQIDISGSPRLLFLLPAASATITVQHYSSDPDNIYLYDGADLDLTAQQALMMLWDGTLIRALNAGASSLTVNNAATGVNLALTGDELSAALDIGALTEVTSPSGGAFVPVLTGAGLRKAQLNNLPGGTTGSGAAGITLGDYADARPSSPASGDIFIARDGYYDFEIFDGTTWVSFKNGTPMIVPPAASGFAWVNQGGATVDDSLGAWVVNAPAVAAFSWRVLKITAPTPPYTVTACVMAFVETIAIGADQGIGLVFRQSSDGKLASNNLFRSGSTGTFFTGMSLLVHKWTSPTVNSANYAQYNTPYLPPLVWLRIADDGANRECSISSDGKHWTLAHSVGRADFLTADEIGVTFGANTSQASKSILLSWEVN